VTRLYLDSLPRPQKRHKVAAVEVEEKAEEEVEDASEPEILRRLDEAVAKSDARLI
jgi:hypothetical protein